MGKVDTDSNQLDLEARGFKPISQHMVLDSLNPDKQKSLNELLSEALDFGLEVKLFVSDDGKDVIVRPEQVEWGEKLNETEFHLDKPIFVKSKS